MRRESVLIGLLAVTLGCGGSGGAVDNSSTFTGHWVGSNGLDQAPIVETSPTSGLGPIVAIVIPTEPLDISSTGFNTISVSGVCAAFNGSADDLVVMDVTGPSTVAGRRHACTPVPSAQSPCATSDSVVIDGGSGSFASGGLVVALTGTYTPCGLAPIAFTYRFSGTKG